MLCSLVLSSNFPKFFTNVSFMTCLAIKLNWKDLKGGITGICFWDSLLWEVTEKVFQGQSYLLIDVCYSVHPAANAHFVPDIGRVTEFMDDTDVIGIGTTKQFLLQS